MVWLAAIAHLAAQTVHYSTCTVDVVQSQNNSYYLQTTPFDNIQQTTLGKTVVFTADSVKMYEIGRHFELENNQREIFLSNDGKTIAYIMDTEFEYDGEQNSSIQIFKDGLPVKQYSLSDLISCNLDNQECYLFYKESIDTVTYSGGKRQVTFKANATDFEKALTQKATFLNNDVVYIFTKNNTLITLHLDTLAFNIFPAASAKPDTFMQYKPVQIIKGKGFKVSLSSLPDVMGGEPFENSLAKSLGMAVYPEGKNQYKTYHFNLSIVVDKSGYAVVDKIETSDIIPEDKIKSFIASQKFETASIPAGIDKWRFSGWITLMNKNKKAAKRERQEEIAAEEEAYKQRLVADSINGLYIPKNIEECFIQLNKLLKTKDIETIKNLKNRSETIMYHHGFGTWLRNNWGLWGGSRLQQYLLGKGLNHPDDMSATILEYYYDWLHGQNEDWKKFDAG